MYLTREAIANMLRRIATSAPSSVLAMTFLLPAELLPPDERPLLEVSQKGARAAGTPFLSLFAPEEMLALARDAGFSDVRHVSGSDLTRRYFAGRKDGLQPGSGEAILVAST
jgi:O-methyltransferase involved in polyketide biosynthesis